MTAYALAHMPNPTLHPEVLEYMERIQSTLDPFDGRFVVHGGEIDVREGNWPGALAMIAFPTMARARGWYESPAYRAILRLRTDHIPSNMILVQGVEPDHDSAAMAAALRDSPAAMA